MSEEHTDPLAKAEALTSEQLAAMSGAERLKLTTDLILEFIKEAGPIHLGHLYAEFVGFLPYDVFEFVIHSLIIDGKIEVSSTYMVEAK